MIDEPTEGLRAHVVKWRVDSEIARARVAILLVETEAEDRARISARVYVMGTGHRVRRNARGVEDEPAFGSNGWRFSSPDGAC